MSNLPPSSSPAPSPQPPPLIIRQPPPPKPSNLTAAYHTFQHYTALGFLLGAPLLVALPPRRLDFYAFALGSSWLLSANHLRQEAVTGRWTPPFGSGWWGPAAVKKAEERRDGKEGKKYDVVYEQLRRETERRWRAERRKEEKEEKEKEVTNGVREELKKASWKEERLAEEREKIARGEGYGSMIMDQIWEVWNGAQKETGEGEKVKGKGGEDGRRSDVSPDTGKR